MPKTNPIEKPTLDRKKVRKVYKKRIYYSFLTFVLILCLFQTVRGVYINVAKYINLNGKIGIIKGLNENATSKNQELKEELHNYNSNKGIEELARNNLKMAGQNEVLVIIKEPTATNKKKKSALRQMLNH